MPGTGEDGVLVPFAAQRGRGGGGEGGHIAGLDQAAGVVGDDLGGAPGAGAKAWAAVSHGLKEDETEALAAARQSEEPAGSHLRVELLVVDVAEELDRAAEREFVAQRLEARQIIATAHDPERGFGNGGTEGGHGRDQVLHALVAVGVAETGDGEDDRGAIGERPAGGDGEPRIEGVGEDDGATLGQRTVFQQLAAGVVADAEDFFRTAEGEALGKIERAPDLDAVGDEIVAEAGIKFLREPGDGELGDVTADEAVAAAAQAQRGADEADLVAGAHDPVLQRVARAAAAEVGGGNDGIVEREEPHGAIGAGEIAEGFQVGLEDPGDAALGDEDLGGEQQGARADGAADGRGKWSDGGQRSGGCV